MDEERHRAKLVDREEAWARACRLHSERRLKIVGRVERAALACQACRRLSRTGLKAREETVAQGGVQRTLDEIIRGIRANLPGGIIQVTVIGII